jgi:hypothetical protein
MFTYLYFVVGQADVVQVWVHTPRRGGDNQDAQARHGLARDDAVHGHQLFTNHYTRVCTLLLW